MTRLVNRFQHKADGNPVVVSVAFKPPTAPGGEEVWYVRLFALLQQVAALLCTDDLPPALSAVVDLHLNIKDHTVVVDSLVPVDTTPEQQAESVHQEVAQALLRMASQRSVDQSAHRPTQAPASALTVKISNPLARIAFDQAALGRNAERLAQHLAELDAREIQGGIAVDEQPAPLKRQEGMPAVWDLVIRDMDDRLQAEAAVGTPPPNPQVEAAYAHLLFLLPRLAVLAGSPDLIADMRQRDQMGRQRYGTPLQPFNGRAALVDAYQEALDLAVYLRQAVYEREGR